MVTHAWKVMLHVRSVSCAIRDVMAELNGMMDGATVSWSYSVCSVMF